MCCGPQMQEAVKGGMSEEQKAAKVAEYEPLMKSATEKIEAAWAESPRLRAMRMVQRAKKASAKGAKTDAWGKVHELPEEDDFDPMDYMGMGGLGGRGEMPPPPPPKPPSKTPRQRREASGEAHVGLCEDSGPWRCDEEGCPAPTVGCTDLKDDCTLKFSALFASPPEGLAQTKVWQQCPKTCDRCATQKTKKSGRKRH